MSQSDKQRRANYMSNYRKENRGTLIAYATTYYAGNREKLRRKGNESARGRYKKNKAIILVRQKEYRKTSTYKQAMSLYRKKGVSELSDWYVAEVIRNQTGLNANLIAPGMIEAKRAILKIKRIIKEAEND